MSETNPQTQPEASKKSFMDNVDLMKACSGYIEATEIARQLIGGIKGALAKGVHHSRANLTSLCERMKDRLGQCKLVSDSDNWHINSNVRMFDLVRYSRQYLHEAQLITDEEYFWLCQDAEFTSSDGNGSPSRKRLEDYDDLMTKLNLSASGDTLVTELSNRLSYIRKRVSSNPYLSDEMKTDIEDVCLGWKPRTNRTVKI